MTKPKIHALAPMLAALGIKQTVSFDECCALLTDVAEKTGCAPPLFELSGNQWCALVNLAVARHGPQVAAPPQAVRDVDAADAATPIAKDSA